MSLFSSEFKIGGISALDLAKKYDTPIYVYDTAIMQAQYERLTSAF